MRHYKLGVKFLRHAPLDIMSDRVNLVAPASPIECLLHLTDVQAIQYKLGSQRLTRLGNSNVQWLPKQGTCISK